MHVLPPAALITMAAVFPVSAQTVQGNVTAIVTNTTGSGISRIQQSCNYCTFTTQPTISINSGAKGGWAFSPSTTSSGGTSTIQYSTSSGGQAYTCQYQVSSLVASPGSCGTPTTSAYATAGKYPAPGCNLVAAPVVDQNTCNVTVNFGYNPS